MQVLATTTNSGSERNKFLSNQSKIKPAVTGRVEVMEGEFTSSEQQTTESRNATVNNPNGCFQNRLWGSLSGNHNVGNLVISGKDKKLVTAIHIQIENMAALPYLVKIGGTRSPELLQVAKEIWDYLLANGMAVTAEYVPSSLNIQANWQSRYHRDLSDWKLNPKMFSQIVKIRGIPKIDLFAS